MSQATEVFENMRRALIDAKASIVISIFQVHGFDVFYYYFVK